MGSEAAMSNPLDWNDVRFFLALAREGTLARAAFALGVDQTTVGRRISALESRLKVAVFARTSSGFELTTAGRTILDAADRMHEAAQDLAAHLTADRSDCSGTVVVATTETLAEHFIVPALTSLRQQCPRVSVALRTGWPRVDLRRGEADLAVRLVRPSDPRLACRKLAGFWLRLYASRDYIASHGVPETMREHAVLGYEEALRSEGSIFTGLPAEDGQIALMANSGRVLLSAVAAGLGIAQLPSYVGDRHPELVPVLPSRDRSYTVWLVLPEAKRRIASVRTVSDAIAAAFRTPPVRAGTDHAAE
jgi:DNA-binding transcriptional LysR family regulator